MTVSAAASNVDRAQSWMSHSLRWCSVFACSTRLDHPQILAIRTRRVDSETDRDGAGEIRSSSH